MKGIRELETQPAQGESLIDVECRVFELRADQMDSEDWLTVDFLLDGKPREDNGQTDDDFFATLRQVSRRRIKPSSPGGASSET